MKLKRCILALVAVLSGFALTTFALAGSDAYSYVAKIGSTEYTSFDDAVNAANQMTGEVTVEIYGKVEYTSTTANLTGAYDKISFVGMAEDAEISITRDGSNGYISGDGNDCAVSFSQLKLSKPSGTFASDAGFMNVAFTIYRVGRASYDECTFPNGACAAGCPTTYTTCTFQKSNEKYALWAYGANVTVAESTFDCDRGIKMYAEGAAKTTELTVTGCDFSKVTDKPAIVLTYGKSVTLESNTYSSTGVFELDHEGDPNGTVVTSDVSLADMCLNDDGDCGVLMDGKIYRHVSEAAAVATAGSTITLLHNSTETVQLPAGVTLDTNGFTAAGVTEAAPTEVSTFEELKSAVEAGKCVKLTADITTTEAIVTTGVTSVVDLNGKTLTIGAGDNKFNDASNIIIKNGTISITGLTVNGNAVFCLDEYEENGLITTLTLEDVNLVGDGYSSAYGIFYIGPSSILNVDGGEWNLKNDTHASGGVFKADASTATLNIDGLTLTGHNVRRGVTYATTTITNSTITFSGDADGVDAEMEHGFNRSPLTISNSTITMTDMVGRGITAEKGAVSISDNSTVTMTNCQEATIDVREGQTVTISDNSTVTLDAEPTITNGSIEGTVKLPAVAKIGETEYQTLEAAFTAAQNGDEVEILKAGTYTLATSGKDITITGKVDGVVFDNIGAKGMNDANVTFNNVTFDYYPNGNYTGLQHSGNLVYNNCIFNGQVFLYGTSETFNKCTFNQNSAESYNVWTYGAKEVNFNECTFNSVGRALLIYSDQSGQTNDVNIVKTTFNASQSVSGKAAIEMDSSIQDYINLTIDSETTATGFDEGNISGNSLWNNKMGNSTEANNDITVTVGGEVVLKPVVLGLSGEGTEASPYLINNLEELKWFRDNVNTYTSDGSNQYKGKYVKLTADIDLAGENWTPIGTNTQGDHMAFLGTFYGEKADGTIPTISNLYINGDGDHLGFFARVGSYDEGLTPTVKNLKFNNVDVSSNTTTGTGGSYVGGVIANAGGNSIVSGIEVTGDVYVVGYGYIGGIIGHGYPDIDNCHVNANSGSYINSHYWCVGGIIGYAGEGGTPITNCSVSGVSIWAAYGGAAAIAGLLQDGNKLENVSASNVTITSNSDYVMGYIAGNGEASTMTNVTVENVKVTAKNQPISSTDAVASVNGKIYFSMAEAIAAIGEGDVTIELLRDATLDYNARDAYGVAGTTSVTINGNGHTLTLNQKNSDWASIGLAGGKLVLNNMTIEKTGYGDTDGHWSTHAIIFSTEVEMNNVTVNNSVAVEGGAVLNNVNINEANAYYGLWIDGNGQTVTVNGGSITATNGGRGIKIADENLDEAERKSVTLNVTGTTFTTAKKAAVLVSSTAGANITASEVNIEKVTEDPVNFVWVDEDWAESYGAVTVTGGTKAQENASKFVASVADAQGNVLAYYPTLDEALAVAQATAGSTLILQSDLTIAEPINVTADLTIDGNGKTLTYTGTDRAITVESETNGADLTLKNLTVDCTASYCQRGVNYNTNGALTLEGVTVKGTNVSYALNLPASSDAATVVINNSSLTGHIALNVWGENANITATDSHFTSVDDTDVENYCAIALNNDGTNTAEGTTITINGGSITALDQENNPSSAVRNATMTGVVSISETTEVTGNIVNPVAVVAYEGSTDSYSCFALQSAIDQAAGDATATVKLLKDVTVDEMLTVNGAVVIDLNGKTVTANCQKAFEVYADATIKNGTIKSQQRCIDTRKNVALTLTDLNLVADAYVNANQQPLTIEGADHGTTITMNKVNINAGTTGYGIISFVKSTLTATESNISGYASLYAKNGSEGSVFTFNNCALEGHSESEGPSDSFAAIVLEESNVTVNVNGGSIKATGNLMEAIAFGSETTEVSGNKVTLSNGATISATNADNLIYANGAGNTAVLPVKPEALPEGYAALPNLDGNYVVGDAPTATVNDQGAKVIEGGEYTVWPSGSNTEDMPLSFVMQFLADQISEDMATSPYADWYADYVLTFEGLENGSFTADGCYLSGYYGSFGWYKIPVDGTKIEEGVRYPVMLGVGMGQKYDYICSGVKDFLCALYLTPAVLAANPNIQVKLELSLVDNSQGDAAAKNALVNNSNIYPVCVTTYNADDFAGPVAKIGETEYKNLQVAIDAAKSGETITLLRDATLREGLTVAADDKITLDLAGYTISQEKECTTSYQMIQNNGSLTITGEGKISFKDTSAGDPNFGWGSYTINNKGTLVVENGTIEHLGAQTFSAHMIAAIQQSAGATTIKGGTVSTPNYRSVRVNSGSLTISGGEFDGQVWLQPNQGDVTLTVTGGTFGPNGEDGSSIFMENVGESYTVSEASISGGTFTTKIGCDDASKLAGTITGGRFSEAAVSGTNKALIKAGYQYATEADADGYYEVKWTGKLDELVIVDGELTEFVNEQELTVGTLTYKRTLASESYNALYVPFEIPVNMLTDKYDVFYIYDVRSYDNDEDGTPEDWDMEVFKFNKGTLKANYPYFIRPKSADNLDMELTLTDATLYEAEENSVVCSSVFMTYEVKGLYHKVESGELNGCYGISTMGRWIPIGDNILNPFRFYLKMTTIDGAPVNVSEEALSSMRIRVIGEGGTTDIEHLKQNSNRSEEVYDLQGRRVLNPTKGFYIVNGKKVYIK